MSRGEKELGKERDKGKGEGNDEGVGHALRVGGGPVITIDGPAGSGKSTTAREVAHRMGFRHLDSGALYRALTYAILEMDLAPEDWESITTERLGRVPIRLEAAPDGFDLILDGRRLDAELRTPRVTGNVSHLAPLPAVRGRLLALQREAALLGGLVADGRDMGSIVFPDAAVKIFLVADLDERARRRLLEHRSGGQDGGRPGEPTQGEIADEAIRLRERDRLDEERELSPLIQPDHAVVIDTTRISFDEQVETILDLVRSATRPDEKPHEG